MDSIIRTVLAALTMAAWFVACVALLMFEPKLSGVFFALGLVLIFVGIVYELIFRRPEQIWLD